jgi:hypothetical protein
MHYVFCTIIDQHFLFKGLTLYSSLQKHCEHFRLYVLCMDENVYELLRRMDLPNLELIRLQEIEDERLLNIKSNRSSAEYCWTCKPYLCLYILKQKRSGSVSYLDGDLFFFSDPYPIYKEIGDSSIAIVEHRFPVAAYSEKVGRFNAGFAYFKNDEEGLQCLVKWREDVLTWCFNSSEDGKFSDQAYLTEWPDHFKNLHVIKHIGVNAGPWNIKNNGRITNDDDRLSINNVPLIFYHFQAFCVLGNNSFKEAAGYFMPQKIKEIIYQPYIKAVKETINCISQFETNFPLGYEKLSFRNQILDILYHKIIPEKLYFQLVGFKHRMMTS